MTLSSPIENDLDGPCFRLQTGSTGGEALFQPARYQLTLINGDQHRRVELGYSGSRLLERLLQAPGEVIAREDLLQYAWAERVVGQGSLNQQIYTLRQLLGDEQKRDIIQTLPRRGYLLNSSALLETLQPATASPAPPQVSPALAAVAPKRTGIGLRWPVALLATGTLLLCGKLAGDKKTDLQSYATLGQLSILYVAQSPRQLAQLQHLAQPAVSGLAELSDQPRVVTVTGTGEFVQILCRNPDSRQTHWLEIHQSRLSAVPEQHLRSCLI
ncbi:MULTISPECIES: transcriptional regulator [unclassified Pseudomonas]|uniref:winged helix-turn-helix domain-containing protein n=1 Tax=unclassified Pseudomonas TaxID=196821 RepID=UPI0035C1BD6A